MSGDMGPREGRHASPSNPNPRLRRAENTLTEKMDIRCTKAEKLEIRAKAEAEGIPASALLREQLGLVTTHRRKSVPRVAEAQIRQITTCCLVLEDIARDVKAAVKDGQLDHSIGLGVVAALIELRRALNSAQLDRSKFERLC
jgi:hypothetical protein